MESTQLYPLKFRPILKEKIRGGNGLKTVLNKETPSDKTGESWELSGVEGDISVVSNGKLAGKDLQELDVLEFKVQDYRSQAKRTNNPAPK